MELAPLEAITPPDPRQSDKTPSLPSWVEKRLTSLREDSQRDPVTGKYCNVWTLPRGLMLHRQERQAIEAHCVALDRLMAQVPATDIEAESETHLAVTKMMLTLAAAKANEAGAAATAEAFEVALYDVPSWATVSAIYRWYRGAHRHERHEQGERYDFTWRPGPALLRKLALDERYRLAGRDLALLQRLLKAVERFESSDVDRARMQEKLHALGLDLSGPPTFPNLYRLRVAAPGRSGLPRGGENQETSTSKWVPVRCGPTDAPPSSAEARRNAFVDDRVTRNRDRRADQERILGRA